MNIKFPYLQDSHATFTYLSKIYPFTEYDLSGKSLLGKDIPILHIGTGDTVILMIAGANANDRISEPILLQFATDFCEMAAKERTVFGLNCAVACQTRRLLILPCMNPDGKELSLFGADPGCPLYERQLRQNNMKSDFSNWKGNARGVLPQWNFNDNFAKRREPSVTGEFPESEPECAFVSRLVKTLSPSLVLECSLGESDAIYTNCPDTVEQISNNTNCTLKNDFIPGAPSWFSHAYNAPSLHITLRSQELSPISVYNRFKELFFRCLYTLAVHF